MLKPMTNFTSENRKQFASTQSSTLELRSYIFHDYDSTSTIDYSITITIVVFAILLVMTPLDAA